jgi:predicted DNA-binding transcriptional regulator AlpA
MADLSQLVTTTDIAKHLGVHRVTVSDWAAKYEHFPEHVKKIGNIKVWDLDEVFAWHQEHPPTPGRRKA